ncbi:MBG domain-containing protein [Terrimonas alba]|uniref:MBG domain-containing protein n=1 Tax=Terrimonas alba TaxID=3349636 RepID=UPI0035F26D90
MRKFKKHQLRIWSTFCFFIFSLVTITSNAQSPAMGDFAIFAGSGVSGSVTPPAPGYGVQIGSSITVNGGSVGSYSLVQTTGNATINSNIYSGGKVVLTNSNVVSGKIAAANSASLPGTILSVGSSANITGNIDVNGNIVIGGGTVSGIVTHPPGTTYSGPSIGSRDVTGTPALPDLPSLPGITQFPEPEPNVVPQDITNTKTIEPGFYKNVTLGGNKTLTLEGVGTYVFSSFQLSGNSNKLVFNFKDATSGNFKIYVEGDADFGKLNTTISNGGDASRIFIETHGKGTGSSIPGYSFVIANGSSGGGSKWLGTVWAPYAGVNVGSGTGSSTLTGALYSGVQVKLQSGVTFNYSPLAEEENVIFPFNPSVGKVSTIIGAELTSLTGGVSDEAHKVLMILGDYVLIDVIARVGHEAEALSYLISEGMTGIISNGTNTLITTGEFPIANLLHLNTRGDIINFCRPVYVPLGNNGLIKNAGDTAIGSQLVRNGYNLHGLGVKIGVLSDSYNSQVTPTSNPAELDITTGEIPGVGNTINSTPVQVVQEFPYGARSDEGRAMLQIIHDIAPKAELAFRTGFISPGDFAVGIKQMQEIGCQVVVDDIIYINEPFLRDGPVAKMVDEVKALGVTYFTSAGNFSNKSHEQNYRPVAAPAGFAAGTTAHDFSGTGDVYQRIRLKPGSYTIALQWDDDIYSIGQTQAGGTKNDFDIYLTDLTGNIICGYNRNNEFGDPFEFLAYSVSSSVAEVDANILITRANTGTATPRFKYIIFRGDAVIAEYQVGGSTIVAQANAAGAIAVAAINYFKTPVFTSATPTIAPYSSIGGTLIGGVDRHKPDITAPDGVNTSVNMGVDYAGDTDPFSNFFGTSAAAPHAAATAALLIEGRKRFLDEVVSPDGVKELLQTTAINVGPANAAGAGLIQADLAMRSFAEPTPFLISLEYPSSITPTSYPTSSFTLTVNGNYLSEESQVLFRGSPVQTTFVSTTELTAIIPAFDSGNPAIQVYTPPIANGDGGYSNIIQFFSLAKKAITVAADPKTKKYGEQLPAFTSTILVDNVPLAQSGLTLEDIGLENLTYATNATPLSNIGSQYFIKPVRTFDLNNPTDAGLLEVYTYDTIPGILTIVKLPVTVIPENQTITYGQDLAPITFRYEVDPAIATANPEVVNIIRLSHEEFLATDAIGLVNKLPVAISNGVLPIAISNGFPIAISNGLPVAISNGEELPLYNAQSVTGFDIGVATVTPYTLTQQELANLSFYASEKSLLSTRQLTPNTKVIDITQESILGYNSDPSLTTMVNTVEPVKAKGVLGAEPLSNGSLPVAISNGFPVAISNAFPVAISNGSLPIVISNGLPVVISNGTLPIAISNSFTEQSHRIAVIIDQADVTEQTGIVLRALNTITGLSSGTQYIIPGSVLNDNYDITYGLGTLTVNPANVTVKANNVTRAYGEPNPELTATYTGLQYGEDFESSDITGSPLLTTTAVQSSPVGVYPITASAGTLSSYNYAFNFENGVLTIENNPCLITHKPFTNFGSTANPGTATSLWLSIVTKVSGQLSQQGDYLLYQFGTVTFNNINSRPAVNDLPIPAGKIIADNVSTPETYYDAATNMWITKVPIGFSSTSDIFITGVIINSSNGFSKKNNANSVVKGIFYSNKFFGDQWAYAIAAYQPQFSYSAIAAPGQVTSINGDYRAGTPTTQLNNLVNGGSGGGGNNYTGSPSSFENFTACQQGSSNITNVSSRPGSATGMVVNESGSLVKPGFIVAPNPAGSYLDISFSPSVPGKTRLSIYTISGIKVLDVFDGLSDAGTLYQKKIDISRLPGGVYFIRLQNDKKNEIKKLIIAR